jgi:hypothetical protein
MTLRRLHHGRPVSVPMTIPALRDATPAAIHSNLTAPAAIHPELTAPAPARAHPIAFDVLTELFRLTRAALPHKRDVFRAAHRGRMNIRRLHHGRPVSVPMTIPAPRDATPAALRSSLAAPAAIHSNLTAPAPARAHPIAFDVLTELFRLTRAAFAMAARISQEAGAELARLNRLGLPNDALAGKSRRERARTVADALNRRHAGHRRCC